MCYIGTAGRSDGSGRSTRHSTLSHSAGTAHVSPCGRLLSSSHHTAAAARQCHTAIKSQAVGCWREARSVALLAVRVLSETRYARTAGDVHIAHQAGGVGPLDIPVVGDGLSHVEAIWEIPIAAQFNTRLASFSRLIRFDKRGTAPRRPRPAPSDPGPRGRRGRARCLAVSTRRVLGQRSGRRGRRDATPPRLRRCRQGGRA